VSDTKSITTSFGYDAAGNISRVTDGRGNTTTYTTNTWGLPESTIEPATTASPGLADRTFITSYDKAGRVSTTLAPGGVRTTRTYDGAGRLTNEAGSGAEASSPERTFAYDAAGRLTSAAAGTAVESFTYNDRGLMKSATGAAGDTSYTWDDEGRATAITTGAGTTTYSYDASGRLSGTGDPLTGETLSYGYDPAGRVATADAGTSKHTYGYDNLGRLASDTLTAGAATTAKISYGYDLADRLTAKTTTGVAGASANTYGYDKAGRLTSWNNGSTTTNFGWDDAGNLTSRGNETATFNARNQVTSRGGVDYAYSARGTLTGRTASGVTRDVEFDAFGQLITDGTQTNRYDALHRLISAAGKAQEYVGAGLDVAYDGDRRYTYAADGGVLGVGAATGDPVSTAMLGWTDQHTDLVGTVDASTGALTGSRTFDPFGSKVASTGVAPALGFQHQYTDPDTGNVAMGARWYQPETGTFASRDAANLDPDDLDNGNRYAYAGANPLTQTDPEGYFWGSVFKAVKKVAKKTVSVAKVASGYNDLKGCIGGSWSSCAWFAAGFTPVGKVAKAVKAVTKTTVKAVKSTKVVRSSAKVVTRSYSYTAKTVTRHAPKVTKKISRTASKASSKVSSTSRGVSRAAAKSVSRAGKAGHAAASAAKAGTRKAAGSAARAGGRAATKAADSVARSARSAKAAVQATKARAKQTVKRSGSTSPAGKGAGGVSNTATVQPKVSPAGAADDAAQQSSEAAIEIADVAPSASMPVGGAGGGLGAQVTGENDELLDFVRARPGFEPKLGRGGLPGSRPALPVTRAGKDETLQRNALSQPDGIARCANPQCSVRLTVAQQSKAGVTPRPDEAAVDHIEAMSKGGSGDPSNTQGLCRVCNIRKSDGDAPW
ncbi:RHS repeat-associated core domain-containing protein, partial [Nocardioides sp.]|uniref:RHS repeat-associated core domain-containing protein n=1 Tax=Nocardioides sp. TaxID=35761 RepID=UPI002BA46A54